MGVRDWKGASGGDAKIRLEGRVRTRVSGWKDAVGRGTGVPQIWGLGGGRRGHGSRTGGAWQGPGSRAEGEQRGSRLGDSRVESERSPQTGGRGGDDGPHASGAGDAPTRRGARPRPLRPRSPPPPRLSPARSPLARPVLAGGDDAVLLGDEQCGRDGVLVPLDLAQERRTAALRPGVDLGRHVRAAAAAAASGASGPSADGRAGGDARVSFRLPAPRGCRAAVSSRVLPPPVLPAEAAQLN